ncbi:hypothetical protein LXL04_000150 [Taraxacum kok-saghyz]
MSAPRRPRADVSSCNLTTSVIDDDGFLQPGYRLLLASPSAVSLADSCPFSAPKSALRPPPSSRRLLPSEPFPPQVPNLSADVKKQTVFFLQTADVWSTSSAAEACRCGPQTADVLSSKKQTAP